MDYLRLNLSGYTHSFLFPDDSNKTRCMKEIYFYKQITGLSTAFLYNLKGNCSMKNK